MTNIERLTAAWNTLDAIYQEFYHDPSKKKAARMIDKAQQKIMDIIEKEEEK